MSKNSKKMAKYISKLERRLDFATAAIRHLEIQLALTAKEKEFYAANCEELNNMLSQEESTVPCCIYRKDNSITVGFSNGKESRCNISEIPKDAESTAAYIAYLRACLAMMCKNRTQFEAFEQGGKRTLDASSAMKSESDAHPHHHGGHHHNERNARK